MEKTPVKDMSRVLHEKIKQYGVKSVFEQLDPCFKATENTNLDGIKTKEKNKITFKSFQKGYERLLKEQKTVENMSFGIRGNPLLLSNVFNILGINSFEDLSDVSFVEPDPKTKLFSIDSKVDSLREQIDSLDERIETHIRKRSRITVFKAAADFDNITKRLMGILENNTDIFIDTVACDNYVKYMQDILKIIDNNRNQEVISNILQLGRYIEKMQKRKNGNNYIRSFSKIYFEKQNEKNKNVLYFLWIICEYSDYCFFLHSLRSYYKLVTRNENDFDSFTELNFYVMSPLYIALLYLVIVLQYIKKAETNQYPRYNDISDKNIIKRIENMDLFRSTKKIKITKSKYHELMTSKLIKRISTIIKHFPPNEHSPQSMLFEKYKNILSKILSLYKKALIDSGKSFTNEIEEYAGGIKNIMGLFNIGLIGVSGIFGIDNEIMDDFDILLNDISTIGRNTMRDLNG